MGQLPRVASFRDLVVYRKAREFSREIFQISRSFPREEMFSLTDQVRRSSRAIGANIAEAWAKRRYGKHFVSNGRRRLEDMWHGNAMFKKHF